MQEPVTSHVARAGRRPVSALIHVGALFRDPSASAARKRGETCSAARSVVLTRGHKRHALAVAAIIASASIVPAPARGGLSPHFTRCHKPPVALRVSQISCRRARWFWRHVYAPHPPDTLQRARGFICTNMSLHPRTDPRGRRGLWVQCVRGPQVFRFHFF